MFQNHKKDVAARVKQLSHRKSSMHSDPALASKINQSLETASGDKDSEEGLRDEFTLHSDLEQEAGENCVKANDEHITVRYSAHQNTEKDATTDSTHLNTDQEIVMNDMHKNLEPIKIINNGHETELNDLRKNADKVTEISTLSHSDMKQEMGVHRSIVQFPTVNSKPDTVSSHISDSVPCDPVSAAVEPKGLRVTEHDPVILETTPHNSLKKFDTVSLQFDISHSEFQVSDSAPTDLIMTKSNVQNVTKLEMDELQSKTEGK
jgi:hypothetical protein